MGAVCATSAACRHVAVPMKVKSLNVRVLEAAAEGNLDKVNSLIAHGGSIESCSQAGRTALHLASAEGHLEIVRLLLSLGANVFVKDRWGNAPIDDALLGGHKKVVQILKDHGAEPSNESKAELEIRLFHFAALGNVQAVADLLQKGTWVNASDYLGKSALHIAAERGHTDVVLHLLNNGANRDCVDLQGDTALNLAMENEHFGVQNILREAGATPHLVISEKRETPSPEKRARRASFTVMEAFPMPIAKAMLDGRKIEPINKGCVSLFFSDIVGFTTISSTIDSATVSRMLNNLFRKFDRLAYVHGVQKVDVIGDAYIAATNFTEDQPDDHAARLARFAIDAMAAAKETPIDDSAHGGTAGMVEIRVGIHCGPVSATVIGTNVVKYTLVGQTVQMASKMESSGLPGRIQCSAAAADLIASQAHDVEVTLRRGEGLGSGGSRAHGGGGGSVSIPGKGTVQTYWVSSVRDRGGRFHSCPDLTDFVRTTSAASSAGGGGGGSHSPWGGGGGGHSPFDLDMGGEWAGRAGSSASTFGVQALQSFNRVPAGRGGPTPPAPAAAGGPGGGGDGTLLPPAGVHERLLSEDDPAGTTGGGGGAVKRPARVLGGADGPVALAGTAAAAAAAAAAAGPVVGCYGLTMDSCCGQEGRRTRRRNSTACNTYDRPSLICRL